jgi:hypothetical protein
MGLEANIRDGQLQSRRTGSTGKGKQGESRGICKVRVRRTRVTGVVPKRPSSHGGMTAGGSQRV